MVRGCTADDFDRIHAIINDAATAYRGIIPDDRWKEPYMPAEEWPRRSRPASTSTDTRFPGPGSSA